jgi:putative ABC transport system substrate-binding protein
VSRRERRRFLIKAGKALSLAAVPFASFAQETKANAKRIGWLEPGTPASFPGRLKSFQQGMRQAGFVEGQNLVVDYRYGSGNLETFPALAAELVALKPDCLVATGVDAINACRRATATIPIVMGTIDADPVKEGIVASLARPGGNITGMIGIAWELAGKRLELLKEIEPKTQRVAVLFDPRSPAGHAHVQEAQSAARLLKMQLQLLEVREPADLDGAFRAAHAARADALFVVGVGMLNTHRSRIVALAIAARVPAVYSNVEFVTDGGLIAYAPNGAEQFGRVATYVDKILKGAKPADLAIVQPTQFELIINMKAAKASGVTIPKSLLARADRVIQ